MSDTTKDESISSAAEPAAVKFTERVPMVKGRLNRKASTATGYAWLVWERDACVGSRLMWVPPCRKTLERGADY